MKHVYQRAPCCRICSGALREAWDLGLQFIYSLTANNAAPLRLGVCEQCELVQLMHTVNPDLLYGGEYYYKSGVNDSMRAALKDVVDCARLKVDLIDGDGVIDIGSNDGTLLSNYPDSINKIGFEPSSAYLADKTSNVIIHDFFDRTVTPGVKIITACAMFYDLNDPLIFLKNVNEVLADDGVFIIQMNYLKSMVENCNFDNISHEHLCYYSLRDMDRLLARVNMYVQDAELNAVNGGSIRLYIRKGKGQFTQRVQALREDENHWRINGAWSDQGAMMDIIYKMVIQANSIKVTLQRQLANRKVCGLGASTRGYVILQYCGLELPLIDRNPEKVGKSLGNMPILSEDALGGYDCALILPYHFAEEMAARYAYYRGELITPIPEVRVLQRAQRDSNTSQVANS